MLWSAWSEPSSSCSSCLSRTRFCKCLSSPLNICYDYSDISRVCVYSEISKLREETSKISGDVLDLLDLIVDSYRFRNQKVNHMNFLKIKLQRNFDATAACQTPMIGILDNVSWEQVFRVHL